MVEAGKVTIGAELNTGNLDSGVDRAKQKLKELGDSANSVELDTKKLGSVLGNIGKVAGVAATAGASFFAGVAAKSPANAAAIARISVAGGKFIRETGEDIAPFVSAFASGVEKTQQFLATDPLEKAFGGEFQFQENIAAISPVNAIKQGFGGFGNLLDGLSGLINPFFGGRKQRESRNEADLN